MAIFDLFSKRQKRLRGEVPDVYVYDAIPNTLRVQLVQIIEDGLGPDDPELFRYGTRPDIYKDINDLLCREYGRFSLTESRRAGNWESVASFLLHTDDAEHVIDVVEVCLKFVDIVIREGDWNHFRCSCSPDDTIVEANTRFREHGVGFEFASGEIIRIDSQLVHRDVIKPALKLISAPEFSGANDEFLRAHEHYRHGRHKECLADCLKSFESVMKTICDQKGWKFEPHHTAKNLIAICMDGGLFPRFLQTHISNLRVILESGVPTARNKLGGHGQGTAVTTVPESLARFSLNSTAANILLFVESAKTP